MEIDYLIILDRSGSMESCRRETISGFNEMVQSVRQAAEKQGVTVKVTLTLFSTDVTIARFRETVDVLVPLDACNYVPEGYTALYDGVGMTLRRFQDEVPDAAERHVYVTILTDGQENHSQHYCREDIAAMIQTLTLAGRWQFTYLGTDQDLATVPVDLGLRAEDVMVYTATQDGTRKAWETTTLGFLDFQIRVTRAAHPSGDWGDSPNPDEEPESPLPPETPPAPEG